MSKERTWTRLDERQQRQVTLYQEDQSLSKSEAIRELVNAGLEKEMGSAATWGNLASAVFFMWVSITAAWWWSNVGLLPIGFYLGRISWILGFVWLLSLVIHLSDTTPTQLVRNLFKRKPTETDG